MSKRRITIDEGGVEGKRRRWGEVPVWAPGVVVQEIQESLR